MTPKQDERSEVTDGGAPIADDVTTFAESNTELGLPHGDTELGAPTAASGLAGADALQAGSRLKHYELVRPLGRGGMGSVFLARDTKLGRLVAIKALLSHSQLNAQRFLAEARATARCRHENIVVIHEVDEFGGCPYMVLEHLEGRTLAEWLAQREQPDTLAGPFGAGRVPPDLAVEVMVPVVRALACAHAEGIVHRDLKPANVFLTDAGPVKVLDFGIAKRFGADELTALATSPRRLEPGDELTQPGVLLGTLPYMAPEQWQGEEVDARSDLWAVGVLLFRLVLGAHPLAPITSALQLAQVGVLDVPMPSAVERCPGIGPLGPIIDRCLKKRRRERFGSADELLAALEVLLPGRRPPALGEVESPFAGLSAFQEGDAARFFGREREVAEALGRLRSQPLLAVAGPSGAGKSSFVRAGVIPALKQAPGSTEAFVLRPGRRPLGALAEVLLQAAESTGGGERAFTTGENAVVNALHAGDSEGLIAVLQGQPGLWGTRLRERCRKRGPAHRLVIFVDQFEELYTLGAGPDERSAFVTALTGAADDASSPLRVLLSVRSDFLDRTAEDRAFVTEVTRGLLLLPPMGGGALYDALLRPVEASGYRFETDAMARAMLGALEHARSPLPLLQFTAAQLWQARDRERRLLTEASYERMGGVAGALSAHADAVLASMSPLEQRLARAALLRLVTPERTRAVVGLSELRALADDGTALEQVVQRLADARLVLVEPSGVPGDATVELTHESLVERWPRLRQWLDESEGDAHFLSRLRAATRQWHEGGEAEGLLWRDRAADEARQWLQRRADQRGGALANQNGGALADLGEREGRYLRAVVALGERARKLRLRAAAGMFVALAAVALVVSLLALRAGREATRARAEAERADREAALARNATRLAAARELMPSDPTSALALLREVEPSALPREWAGLAFQALHGGVSSALLAHPAGVHRAAFSPDGKRVATAAADKTLRVFNADGSGEPLALEGHGESLLSAVFSPDGKRIASASFDKTIRVWSADGTGEPLVLRGHEAAVYAVAWSPDGQRLASASLDKFVRIYRTDGSGEPLVLKGHEGGLRAVAFSPDGQRLASSSLDRTVRVWDADGAGKPLVLRHTDRVYAVSWAPDGRRLVTASEDKLVRIWTLRDAAKPAGGLEVVGTPLVLRGHTSEVYAASFSPDGQKIVSSSVDGTARVWDATRSGELRILRGHGSEVLWASFSPDGRRIVTASLDKTVRVWDEAASGQPLTLRGHGDEIQNAAISHDGRRVVSASLDKTARVWNVDGSGQPSVLRGHAGEVLSASFSPDGKRVVTTSADKTLRIWDETGSGKPLVLRGHGDEVQGAIFSPDGKRIASASLDKTVRVWNADGQGEPLVLRGHEGWVLSVTFSPDGRQIVSSSWDGTVRLWPSDGAGEPLILRGHKGAVTRAIFSPDGRRLATASKDTTLRIWGADGQGEPLVLRGHDDMVTWVAWSPDGRQLVSASSDKTVRVWGADGKGEPLVLRGHEGAVGAAEWAPDGRHLITASADKTLRVWPDLEPVRNVDDAKLWSASSYCLPAERRVGLLHTPEAIALTDLQACRRRVEGSR